MGRTSSMILARLTSILTQKSGNPALLNFAYTYFANGQIQQITNSLDSLKTEKYSYDDLGRLLTAQRGPDNNIQRKYEYDYDRFGNRWAQNLVAGSGFPGTNSFDYASNRVNSPNFSFDASGNMTANGAGTSYTFNPENFITAAGTTITYAVDTLGRRTKKIVSGVTTNYFYTGSVVISEKQGSTWTDYIFFADQRIAQQTGSALATAKFLHQDHLGSTRVCTDGSGNWAGSCDYEPFGEFQPGSACSNLPTNYRFADTYYDSESGLYYTWFRQYDPNQGHWMGVDPLPGSSDDPQSLDRYGYVTNDSPNLLDPLGLCVWVQVGDPREGPSEVEAFFCFGGGQRVGDEQLRREPREREDLEQKFKGCLKKYGDKYAQQNLTLKGFLAAQNAAATAQIDTSTALSLWDNESKFSTDVNLRGAHGEIGPIQIKPGAVKELRGAGTLPTGYATDLTSNLTAGALYYARLSDHYNIPEVSAAAAYNGGPYGYKKNRAAQAYQKAFNTLKSIFSALVNCMRQ